MKELISTYRCVTGVFNDPKNLFSFLELSKTLNFRVIDVFSPYCLPGLINYLPARGKKYSLAGFASGIAGLAFSLFLVIYIFNKPVLQFGSGSGLKLAYIVPILFLFILFFAAIILTAFFTVDNHLLPGQISYIPDFPAGEDQFIVIIQSSMNTVEIKKIFENHFAIRITENEYQVLNYSIPIPLKTRRWEKH
jgi:hypothetical protein